MFLLDSPQLLATNPKFIYTMFECRTTGLFQSVVLDVFELLAQQGASFRAVIFKVGIMFLQALFSKQDNLPQDNFALN